METEEKLDQITLQDNDNNKPELTSGHQGSATNLQQEKSGEKSSSGFATNISSTAEAEEVVCEKSELRECVDVKHENSSKQVNDQPRLEERAGEVVIFIGDSPVAEEDTPSYTNHKLGKRQRGGSEFVCRLCSKTLGSLDSLNHHEKRHFKEKLLACQLCGKKFYMITECKRHEVSCKKKPHRCRYCLKCFSSKDEWDAHMKKHTEGQNYKCEFCSGIYIHQRSWRQHMRKKHPQNLITKPKPWDEAHNQFDCQYCHEKFDVFDNYREHMLSHSNIATKDKRLPAHQCKLCPKAFASYRGLRSHQGTAHAKEMPECISQGSKFSFQCELCGKVMSKKNGEYHMRTHSGERPFECQDCGKTFASKPNLKEHMRTHTGEKPYKCRFCASTFTASGSRIRHERSHTGEKPYECQFCGKTFRSQAAHVVHERSHTGETPYQCTYCEKKFTYRGTFLKHERTHHKPKSD